VRTLQYITFQVEPQNRPPNTLRSGNEKSRMIQVIGTQPSLFHAWSLDLENGRMFTEEEGQTQRERSSSWIQPPAGPFPCHGSDRQNE